MALSSTSERYGKDLDKSILPATEEHKKSLKSKKNANCDYKLVSANPSRTKVSISAQPGARGGLKSLDNLKRPDSHLSCTTISERNQGPRVKSTLYRTSSPGPGESITKQNKLVTPNVGRQKMRAVAIKTFDIDQGHFLVYVRASCKRYEMSKCGLKPVIDAITIAKVKQLAGKYLNLLPASLNMFGLFGGELGKSSILYQDTDVLPNDIDQFCFQRLNFISSDEIVITNQDSRAMELIFWEVKNIFENGKIWPLMKQPQWKKLFDVSAECQKEWITKSIIPFQIMKKFIETLRATIPLFYWSCYYWCHSVLQSRLKGREKGTEVIVIPDINELTLYDTTLGKKFVSWRWSRIASIKLKADSMKVLIFDVLIKNDDKCDMIRDIVICSDQCQYIFTIIVHIINLLEELHARYCHYPLGILWTKNKRVPKIQDAFYRFDNKTLCEPISSALETNYTAAEVLKECCDGSSLQAIAKEDRPAYHLQSISVQGDPVPSENPGLIRENVFFKLTLPKDCIREITVMHYFDTKPVTLTVVVTPKGDSRLKVQQIRKEIGFLLGMSDLKGISIFGLFKNEKLLGDNMLLPLSNDSSRSLFWFKRLSFDPLLEDYIINKEECILKALFTETYQIVVNASNRPAISTNHCSALLSIVSSGSKGDSKPTVHQMTEFMKYMHIYIPFYWQSFYGAPGFVSENSTLTGIRNEIEVFLSLNIHKLEILSHNCDSKQIFSWLWVQIHSVEQSKLSNHLITFRGIFGKQKKLVTFTFNSPRSDYLFSIVTHIFKLLEEKYKLIALTRKDSFTLDKPDVIINNAFYLSDSKLQL